MGVATFHHLIKVLHEKSSKQCEEESIGFVFLVYFNSNMSDNCLEVLCPVMTATMRQVVKALKAQPVVMTLTILVRTMSCWQAVALCGPHHILHMLLNVVILHSFSQKLNIIAIHEASIHFKFTLKPPNGLLMIVVQAASS